MAVDSQEDFTPNETCPICDGSGEFIGYLGKHPNYRCRQCGSVFDVKEGDSDASKNKITKQGV